MSMLVTLALAAALTADPASLSAVDNSNTLAPNAFEQDVKPALRLTFTDALARGLAHNASVGVAQREVERANAIVAEVRSSSLPVLSANGNIIVLDHDRTAGAGIITTHKETLSGNLTLGVPLSPLQWGRWSQARTNVKVSEFSNLDVRRSVALSVAHAYLSVITQGRIVDVTEQSVITAHQHFEYSQARYKGGVGNHLDELRADQEWANAQAQVEQALTSRIQSREALGILIGEDQPVDVADDLQPKDVANPNESLQHIGENRADLLYAQGRVEQTHEVLRDSWLDFMPTLLAAAQGVLADPTTSQFPSPAWSVGLYLTIPLFDGGQRYGLHDERAALVAETEVQMDVAFRQARSEVRTSYEAVRHAEKAFQASQRGAQKAREALDLANVAYRAGATSNLEVIDAERTSRDADIDAVIADDTVRRARIDLLTAAGLFP